MAVVTAPLSNSKAAVAAATDTFTQNIPFEYERHSFGERAAASMQRVSIETHEEETEPDKTYLNLRKRLLQSQTITAIRQHDIRFQLFLKYHIGTPWKPGLYLVPVGYATKVYDEAVKWEKDRKDLADKAEKEYPALVKEMATKLGPLYNPQDYPSAKEFRSRYWVKWGFRNVGVPAQLKTLRADIFRREQAKIEAEGKKAAAAIEQHMRSIALELTTHVADLLRPKSDGKFRALRDGALDDFLAFLDTVNTRSGDDNKLKQIASNLKKLAKGLSLEDLRAPENKQQRIDAGRVLEQAKMQLEGMVVAAPTRAIRMRDES